MRYLLFIAFAASFAGLLSAQNDCKSCLNAGNKWCATTNKCMQHSGICITEITKLLNCPRLPDANYSYTDAFGRSMTPLIVGAYSPNGPQNCLTNQLPTVTFYKDSCVTCFPEGPETTCYAYTASDSSQKVIIVVFRGTTTFLQTVEEIEEYFKHKTDFFNHGKVFKYFYDGFMDLWNGGIESQVRSLKYQYPDYSAWVVGHSLGGAMASIAASYLVQVGLFDAKNIRLLTFGQPRTGDYDYAAWHDETFPYSYRIVHHRDIGPHIPPQKQIGDQTNDDFFHHRFEVWYNNDMSVGSPFTICKEADGPYCSNTQVDIEGSEHWNYFNVNMTQWAIDGCPK